MSRVDIFLLAIMASQKELSLAKITQKVAEANINKPPSRLAIYKRLQVLSHRKLINVFWQKKEKFYKISIEGKSAITEFKNQLNRAESA